MFKTYSLLIMFIFFALLGCNKNLTEEEKKELWSKAQTTGEIINRSGTPFNSANNKSLALSDAQNRLVTGGGLFGKKMEDVAEKNDDGGDSDSDNDDE